MADGLIVTNTALDGLRFLPVPAGGQIGLDEKVAERFINAYGADWVEFFRRETPIHEVKIGAFALAGYPTTNSVYELFMAQGGYSTPEYWTPEGWAWKARTGRAQPLYWSDARFAGANRPVVGVSWFEAMAVARWAAIQTGQNVRLPSEAEWEWASRGDNMKSLYPWGGAWDPTKLNSGYKDDKIGSVGSTTPVGQYSPMGDGPFGHADMLGQVWEWTNSLFRPYPYVAGDGREDRYTPDRRVMRGGNWSDGKYTNRATTRYHYPGYFSDSTTGFRLALGGDAPAIAPRAAGYDVVVFGRSSFCPDLIRAKVWLHAWNVPYRQVQVDLEEEMAYKLDAWLGSRTVPTIIVARQGEVDPISPPIDADLKALRNMDRGSMLHEPEEGTLRAFLARHGFLPG
jgi:formylglycine-generating enzyme required for sulfatase activity/glutaredoxin